MDTKKKIDYIKRWRKNNPDKVKKYAKISRDRHKEEIATKQKEWVSKNRDKMREYQRNWKLQNREKVKKQQEDWRLHNPLKSKFFRNRARARERGISFDLSYDAYESILTNSVCAYCSTKDKLGLDRVVNERGYELTNVVPCCMPCNARKGNRKKSYMDNKEYLLSGHCICCSQRVT